MTMTLPLQPQEEARLAALAQAKGVSTDTLLRVPIDKILADAPDQPDAPKRESHTEIGPYQRGDAGTIGA
jgi:hypothetical protein